jgi:hypothetical protein
MKTTMAESKHKTILDAMESGQKLSEADFLFEFLYSLSHKQTRLEQNYGYEQKQS